MCLYVRTDGSGMADGAGEVLEVDPRCVLPRAPWEMHGELRARQMSR